MSADTVVPWSDRYAVERALDGGRQLVRERADGRTFVLRELGSARARGVDPARFLAAISAAPAISHEHLAPPLAWQAGGGRIWSLAPCEPGSEGVLLSTWLEREHALPYLEAARVLREVAAALAHAHAHGVAHLAFSASEVTWVELHARLDGLGLEAALCVARGSEAAFDPRADVRDLGVLSHEVLVGSPPRAGDENGAPSPAEASSAAGASPRPEPVNRLREHVPPGLARAIVRALDPDPARRPDAAELARLFAGLVTPAPGYRAAHWTNQGDWLARRGIPGCRLALDRYARAIELDPRFVRAHAGAAAAWSQIARAGGPEAETALAGARRHADAAAALERST